MIEISIKIQLPNLDRKELELECPVCKLHNWTNLGQIRRRDYLVCRGCHSSILLEDHMSQIHRFIRQFKRQFEDWM